MSDKPENPPAFPLATVDGYAFDGMYLRDYLAAKAMQSLIAYQTGTEWGNCWPWEELSRMSYEMADAMLAERSKP